MCQWHKVVFKDNCFYDADVGHLNRLHLNNMLLQAGHNSRLETPCSLPTHTTRCLKQDTMYATCNHDMVPLTLSAQN